MRRVLGSVVVAAGLIGTAASGVPGQVPSTYRVDLNIRVEVKVQPDREKARPAEAEVKSIDAGSSPAVAPTAEIQQSDPGFDPTVARPAYSRARPRVIIDEAHANFHTAEGRYRPFARLIGSDGYAVSPGREKFTPEGLAKGDILVIANARGDGPSGSAISDAEADAVVAWVREGGSLLLITDRPPFSAGTVPLADRLGVDMSLARTFDPANSRGNAANLVFDRGNGLLGDHPILRGRDDSERVGRVLAYDGQSLRGPGGSVPLLRLGEGAYDLAGPGAPPVRAAGRAQGLAFGLGKGRVVMLGEAGLLSAQTIGSYQFGMNVPGSENRQFALNIMHWLSGLLGPEAAPR